MAQQPGENLPGRARAENLAYVIYTSGSTGRPKGAMIPHRGLVNYLCWSLQAYPVAAGQGCPVHSSIGFDLTITSLFAPLLAGRTAVLLRNSPGSEALEQALRTQRDCSLVKLTPSHLDLLNHHLPAHDLAGRTHALVIGGEALHAETLVRWRTQAPSTRLFNEYGPTETVVGCCVHEVTSETSTSGVVPIGRPIANTRIYILNAHCNPVPIGVTGELYIAGDGLARGYHRRPALTAERFVPNPFATRPGERMYRTGDLARYLPDGTIEFLGRFDHQVKLRGYRIELGEIEAVLNNHAAVRQSAVVVLEHTPGDKRLVAYVGVQPEHRPDAAALRRHLQQRLPAYMVPSTFVLLETLPLTDNGKVDRVALPAPENDPQDAPPAFVAPRTTAEDTLAAIWCDLLRLDRVGAFDNFFELGGHSLLATRMLVRVREAFEVEIPLLAVFETPTLASLAQLAEGLRRATIQTISTQEAREAITF